MQAPAVGRGLSELLLHGRYQTLDLSRLGYQRILDGPRCMTRCRRPDTVKLFGEATMPDDLTATPPNFIG